MYDQLITPNYNIPYVGGLCEGYVEGTVGQATLPTPSNPVTYGVYPTATAAWLANNGNHPEEQPPVGLSMAVYFELGNNPAGHVALQLKDGRVASTSQAGYHSTPYIYPSLKALITDYGNHNKGCKYLGWSEGIGHLQVIKKEQDMATPCNLNDARILAFFILGWKDAINGGSDAELEKNAVGRDLEVVIQEYYLSPDGQAQQKKLLEPQKFVPYSGKQLFIEV